MSPLNITQPLDSIRYMVYNGYYKVMSNIPKMGHLTTPVSSPGKVSSETAASLSPCEATMENHVTIKWNVQTDLFGPFWWSMNIHELDGGSQCNLGSCHSTKALVLRRNALKSRISAVFPHALWRVWTVHDCKAKPSRLILSKACTNYKCAPQVVME